MNISFMLPDCMTSGVCTACGGCATANVKGLGNSEYDPKKAGEASKVIWEDGGLATFFTGGKINATAVVTYSFVSKMVPTDFNSPGDEKIWGQQWGFTGKLTDLTEVQKNAIRQTAKYIGEISGLTLIEVSDPAHADIRWRGAEFNTKIGINPGVMHTNDKNVKNAGTIFFNSAYQHYSETVKFEQGERGYGDMLHEWGHMIGLKHSNSGINRFEVSNDHRGNTVMSHLEEKTGLFASTLTDIDLSAVRYIYGSFAKKKESGISYAQLGQDGMISRADESARFMVGLDGGRDAIYGGVADDTIAGLAGDDTIFGGGGTNVLNGGAGIDSIVWRGTNADDLKTPASQIIIWNQDYTGKSWSGIMRRKDGSLDFFTSAERLVFDDKIVTSFGNNQISLSISLERLFNLSFEKGSSPANFSYHMNRLSNNSITMQDLAKEFINSVWFKKSPLWDSLSLSDKISILWARTFPGTKVPDSLQAWSSATNDFYGAVEAIISVRSPNNLNVYSPNFSFEARTFVGGFDAFERSAQKSTVEIISEAYQILFGRAGSSAEISDAIQRHDWRGVSFTTIFNEMVESAEFRDLLLNANPSISNIRNHLQFDGGSLPITAAALVNALVAKIVDVPDFEDRFSLLARNGSYGLTLGTEIYENDTVVSYSYKKAVKKVYFTEADIRIVLESGLQITAPKTVQKIEFFDGTFFLNNVNNEYFWQEISKNFITSKSQFKLNDVKSEIGSVFASRDAAIDALFSSTIFGKIFTEYADSVFLSERVQSLYRSILDRDPVARELQDGGAYLAAGGSFIELARTIAKGPELAGRYSSLGSGVWVSDNYQALSIKIYEILLGRVDNWWASGLRQGYELAEIVDDIMKSNEFVNARLRGSLDNSEFAQLVGRGSYGQGVEASKILAWTQLLDSGVPRRDIVITALNELVYSKDSKDKISVQAGSDGGLLWDLGGAFNAAINLPSAADARPGYAIKSILSDNLEGTGNQTHFHFKVYRTGNEGSAGSVGWAVTGFGSNPATAEDFVGSSLPSGRIEFAIGQTVVDLFIPVIADLAIEADEGFLVTLSAPSGSIGIRTPTASGAIYNDDLAPHSRVTIEQSGSTGLGQSNGWLVIENRGVPSALLMQGAPVQASGAGTWQPVAAEANASGYLVAWRLANSDISAVWQTDSAGNFRSNTNYHINRYDFQALETTFGQDLNGDGTIGLVRRTVESNGAVKLTQVVDRYTLDTANTSVTLLMQGAPVQASGAGTWQPVAAEANASGYLVAWRLANSDISAVWQTDSAGNFRSNTNYHINRYDFQALETTFGQDLNGDGTIGLVRRTVESNGAVKLTQVVDRYTLDTANTSVTLLMQGAPVQASGAGTWQPVAAEANASGYLVAWRLANSDISAVWQTDSAGNFRSNTNYHINRYDFQALETTFGQDLNGDGTIGLVRRTVESNGAVKLTQVVDRYTLDTANTSVTLLMQGAPVQASGAGTWQPVAAEANASGYLVAWRLANSDISAVWQTDSAGNFRSNTNYHINRYDFQALETTFGQDLNGDGTIGLVRRTVESNGAVKLTQVVDRYTLDTANTSVTLLMQGAPVQASGAGTWQPVAAEANASGYLVAWRLANSDISAVWQTDSAGNFRSNTNYHINRYDFQELEITFGQDLNGDGTVGPRIVGTTGNDLLRGGNATDVVLGDAGDDFLYGLAADDTLIGGPGADFLDGGPGKDRLEGGSGADLFYLASAVDANRDEIVDFRANEGDMIDLRLIDANVVIAGDQAFTWLGSSAFSVAAGQLRFSNFVLEGDVDGDGKADFQIQLSGVASLSSANIWL